MSLKCQHNSRIILTFEKHSGVQLNHKLQIKCVELIFATTQTAIKIRKNRNGKEVKRPHSDSNTNKMLTFFIGTKAFVK